MTHKYCLDTSGFSNPLMEMPEDIHKTLWPSVVSKIEAHIFCWNVEIATKAAEPIWRRENDMIETQSAKSKLSALYAKKMALQS